MSTQLVVALDVAEQQHAERLVDELGDSVQWYKIGKRPYELPEVYLEFPTTFNLDYTKLPKRFELLFEQHCL